MLRVLCPSALNSVKRHDPLLLPPLASFTSADFPLLLRPPPFYSTPFSAFPLPFSSPISFAPSCFSFFFFQVFFFFFTYIQAYSLVKCTEISASGVTLDKKTQLGGHIPAFLVTQKEVRGTSSPHPPRPEAFPASFKEQPTLLYIHGESAKTSTVPMGVD